MTSDSKSCPFRSTDSSTIGAGANSEALYRAILEAAVDSIITIDEYGVIQSVNAAIFQTFGYSPEELIGQNVGVLMPSPFSQEHDTYIARYLKTGQKRIIGIGREVLGRHKDGSLFPIELSVSEIKLPGSRLFTGIVRDITDRKQVEEALLAERNRVQQYLDIAAVGIISLDSDGRIESLNHQAASLLHCCETDALGQTLEEVALLDEQFLIGLSAALISQSQQSWKSQFAAGSSSRVIDWHSSPLSGPNGQISGYLLSATDITELSRAKESLNAARLSLEQRVKERTDELSLKNIELSNSVREKEVLLKEIHHRVKNNLQLISSLLNLQVRNRKGMTVEQMVYEVQGRIQSIALLHEMLYQSEDLSHIDFDRYISALADTIVRYYGMGSRIRTAVSAEKIKLSLDGSIYCGLLLNELITNAMKHAFPVSREGTLSIAAHRVSDDCVRLSVQDDGVGIPETLNMENVESLGLELVQQLTTKLRGQLSISRERGTRFELIFIDRG